MSFDARSRERLEALGRSLPQKLPLPSAATSPSAAPSGSRRDTTPRHRVEIEENPEDLFRALMQASADGSVPPHLLERLRELEAAQPARRAGAISSPEPDAANRSAAMPARGSGTPSSPPPRRPAANRNASPPRRATGPERELYDAFDDLLHIENDDAPDQPPPAGREPNDRLMPRPTLRQARPGSDRG